MGRVEEKGRTLITPFRKDLLQLNPCLSPPPPSSGKVMSVRMTAGEERSPNWTWQQGGETSVSGLWMFQDL